MWLRTVGLIALIACSGTPHPRPTESYDVLITGGAVYDGSGGPARDVDIAIRGDKIAALLERGSGARAARVIDARGLGVAPGFINVLSWSTEVAFVDGRAMSDVLQGVTLEVFGEGFSYGPLNDYQKTQLKKRQGDIKYDVTWSTLGEYLDTVVARGFTPNVASFIGAGTVRVNVLGEDDRQPSAEELARMQELVRAAMREGALGVGSALIYAPGVYAKTDELIALARAAGEFGGGYATHMRSEANDLLGALDETVRIAREARVHAGVYHLKAAGHANWAKMTAAIERIEQARREGISINACMYTYEAGATGLDAAMPPWVQEGGHDAWMRRLKDPALRARAIAEIKAPANGWESLYQLAGSPERVKFIGFKNHALKPLTGKTLAEVAAMRGKSAEETIVDLVVEDDSRVECVYFLMSEDNVKLGLRQPWVSLCSDAEASAPEGVFLLGSTHPRAYGNFARFLGHYVRDQQVATLADAIRRLTRLPAETWKLTQRGCLDAGCFADVVVFDPRTITDHATYDRPMQFATGVRDVLVNGVPVVTAGKHTGAKPGRVVRGPGYR